MSKQPNIAWDIRRPTSCGRFAGTYRGVRFDGSVDKANGCFITIPAREFRATARHNVADALQSLSCLLREMKDFIDANPALWNEDIGEE